MAIAYAGISIITAAITAIVAILLTDLSALGVLACAVIAANTAVIGLTLRIAQFNCQKDFSLNLPTKKAQ